MAGTLSVTPQVISKQMHAGQPPVDENVVFTRVIGNALVGYHGKVEPSTSGENWITLEPRSFALDPSHLPYALVTIKIAVPDGAPRGRHCFQISFDAEEPGSQETCVNVEIDVRNPIETWLQRHVWHMIVLGLIVIIIAATVGVWVVRTF